MSTEVRLIQPAGVVKTLSEDELKTVQDDLVALAHQLDDQIGHPGRWVASVSSLGGDVTISLKRETDDHGYVKIRRVLNRSSFSLDHDYFAMSQKLQGKGLADVVLGFSKALADRFELTNITLNANLDVGGYAWLRKGFFPKHEKGAAARALLGASQNEVGYNNFLSKVKNLSDDEVKAYVLSPEFSQHKNLFLGSNWYGSADLTDPAVRAALFKPSAKSQIADATLHSVMLERLKAAEVRDYNQLVPILQRQVDMVLTQLKVDSLTDLKRGELNAVLRLLRESQKAALLGANGKLETRLKLIAEYEAGFEAAVLQEYAKAAGAGAVIAAPTAATAWVLATTVPLSATGDLLGAWVAEMTQAEVDLINKAFLRAYSEGWTNDDLRKILSGTKAMNFTDGLLPRMAKHNATIVRTAIQHVAGTAREATWRANEDLIEKYQWVSTLDSRTSPQCRSLDGQQFEIGKGPRPPIHPNCRSTTIAVLKGKLKVLSQDKTRASADGPVDANLTYYEWLSKQSAAFQKDVLGPSRYKLFKADGMTAEKFAKLQLNAAFEPLTLEELAARR